MARPHGAEFVSTSADAWRKWRSLLVVAVLSFVLSLAVTHSLVKNTHQNSNGNNSGRSLLDLPISAIVSSLPSLHHPRQLAIDGCRALQSYEDSLGSWTRGMAQANTLPLSGDNILAKVAVSTAPLTTKVRLVCIVPSIDSDGRARKAQQYWGHKCDEVIYVTNKATIDGIDQRNVLEVHPAKDDKNAWQRLRSAFHHVATTPVLHDHTDFFLYAGDDSFVVVENLKKFLAEPYVQYLHSAGAPLYLGHRMVQTGANAPFVSGAAIILNRLALDIFVAVADNVNCDPTSYSESEDILVASCLRHHNIHPLNTQDVFGEDRLHMFDAGGVAAIIRDPSIASWYPPYRRKAMPKGIDGGASRYSFHFHGIQEHMFDEYVGKLARD